MKSEILKQASLHFYTSTEEKSEILKQASLHFYTSTEEKSEILKQATLHKTELRSKILPKAILHFYTTTRVEKFCSRPLSTSAPQHDREQKSEIHCIAALSRHINISRLSLTLYPNCNSAVIIEVYMYSYIVNHKTTYGHAMQHTYIIVLHCTLFKTSSNVQIETVLMVSLPEYGCVVRTDCRAGQHPPAHSLMVSCFLKQHTAKTSFITKKQCIQSILRPSKNHYSERQVLGYTTE